MKNVLMIQLTALVLKSFTQLTLKMLKRWRGEKVQNFVEVNLIRYNLSLTSLSAGIKVERDTQPLNINLKSAPGRDFWNIGDG